MDPSIIEAMFGMPPKEQMTLLAQNKESEMLPLLLENVCTTLVMGFEEYLRAYNAPLGLQTFVDIGMKHVSGSGDIATLTMRGIALVLEHVPNSNQAAQENPMVMQVATTILGSCDGLLYESTSMANCVEECLRVVNFVATEDASGAVGGSGIVAEIVKASRNLDTRSMKLCIDTLSTICRKMVLSSGSAPPAPAPKKSKGKSAPPPPAPKPKMTDLAINQLKTSLLPHLHNILCNSVDTAAIGDQWPLIESSARCLAVICNTLVRRVPPLGSLTVTPQAVDKLFEAYSKVAQSDAQRMQMLVVLCSFAEAAPAVVWKELMGSTRIALFESLLKVEDADPTVMLQDPFGMTTTRSGGDGSSSSRAKDKPLSTLLVPMAIRLLTLCMDPIPLEFTHAPATVLPVHRWSWEDDVHTYTDYHADHSITIETAYAKHETTASIHAASNTYTVDFLTMKQSRGGLARNVRRADLPFTVELRPNIPDTAPEAVPCGLGDAPVAISMNPKIASKFLKVYLPLLMGHGATSSSDMVRYLCATAVVQAIHACLPADLQLSEAIGEVYESLGDYIIQVLSSTSVPVVDTGLVILDLLYHHRFGDWTFPVMCRRSGIGKKLSALAGKSSFFCSKRAAFIRDLVLTSQSPTAAHSPLSTHGPLLQRVNLLMETTAESVQEEIVSELITEMENMSRMSSNEFEEIGIARGLLSYLLKTQGLVSPSSPLTASSAGSFSNSPQHSFNFNTGEGFPFASRENSFAAPGTPSSPQPTLEQLRAAEAALEKELELPEDPIRLARFVELLEKNPESFKVLVLQLVDYVRRYHENLPETECLTTNRAVKCRSLGDAINLLGRISPNCDLCSDRTPGDDGSPRSPGDGRGGAPPKPNEVCPQGHLLRPHRSTSWQCDNCEEGGEQSMACRACDFDLCMDCFEDPDSGYEGGTPVDIGPVLSGSKVHLLSAAGDIEKRLNGSGSDAVRGLQGLRGELENILARIQQAPAGSATTAALQHAILQRSRQLETAEAAAAARDRSAVKSAANRLELYYEGVGKLPFNEPLIGSLFRKAFNKKILPVLETFETCLMCLEGKAKGIASSHPKEKYIEPFAKAAPTRQRTLFMHVFVDSKGEPSGERCTCGELIADECNQEPPSKLRRRACAASRLPEFRLLRLLRDIACHNGRWIIPPSLFESLELSASISRSMCASALRLALLPPQLALPRWVLNITEAHSYLLPRGVRMKLAQFMTFGARKAMWETVQKMNMSSFGDPSFDIVPHELQQGSPSRRTNMSGSKHHVSREGILQEAEGVLKFSAETRGPLAIEFDGDAGTGLGPTIQFFTKISQELCRPQWGLWRWEGMHNVDPEALDTFVVAPTEGLFPAPLLSNEVCGSLRVPPTTVPLMRICGMALARGFMDGRILSLPLSPMLFSFLRNVGAVPAAFDDGVFQDDLDVSLVDRSVNGVMAQIEKLQGQYRDAIDEENGVEKRSKIAAEFEAMDLTFTLPGCEGVELCPGGGEKIVNSSNADAYCAMLSRSLLVDAVKPAVAAFLEGFMDILPTSGLHILSPEEINTLMCGVDLNAGPLWTQEEMQQCIVASHGYSKDSPQLEMLIDVISNEFGPLEQSKFLAFCTGCPRVPVGGLKALGSITVVKKELPTDASPLRSSNSNRSFTAEPVTGDAATALADGMGLPSVNTCFRYLKLPPYPHKGIMKDRLWKAISESGDSFELS